MNNNNNTIEISAAHGLLALRDQHPLTPPSEFISYDTEISNSTAYNTNNTMIRRPYHLFFNRPTNKLTKEQINTCPPSYTQAPNLHNHFFANIDNRNLTTTTTTLPSANSYQSLAKASNKHKFTSNSTLPSINEMLSQSSTPAQSQFMLCSPCNPPKVTRVTAFHPYHRNHPATIQVQVFRKKEALDHSSLSRPKKVHFKNTTIKQDDHHQILTNIKTLDKSELNLLFQNLQKYYREKYNKELTLQDIQESDMDIDDEESADDSSYSTLDSVNENSKRVGNSNRKKPKNNTDKPRWTVEEKAELFEAVIRHKSLDVMSTFDWAAIGADIGRVDKACKDQWRRGVLKMLKDSFFTDL